MLIQSLEQKTRLALTVALAAIFGSVVICSVILYISFGKISEERNQIYILDGQIPFLAERAELESTYEIEAKAHINMFHQHFFNLPPDNEYIDYSIGKAMYLADGSALKQKKAMEEKGFFSDLVSSSAVCSIICDSINIDHETNDFTYYGRQLIKRRTSQIKRSMITTGRLHSVPRSKNNPHGLMIVNWRTLENKDIK